MATEKTGTKSTPVFDAGAFDEAVTRIRDLNEKIIAAAKETGQASLDAYEQALQSMVDFEEQMAGQSQLDWVTALANTHVKFVQEISAAYIKAARAALS